MDEQEVLSTLRRQLGTPRRSTLDQIMATIRDHGGCILIYDGRYGEIVVSIGAPVARTPDTVVMAVSRTY